MITADDRLECSPGDHRRAGAGDWRIPLADGRVERRVATVRALRYGMLDGERRARATAQLLQRIEARNWHLSTGSVGTTG